MYFGFVVIKAVTGYLHWGPLALRDAALFYYAAFAVMAYYAYRSDYFKPYVVLSCYAVLIGMFFIHQFNDFWYLGRICLGFVLALSFPNKKAGVLMALGVLIFSPHQYFMETNRTVILANFLIICFMMFTATFLLDRNLRRKFWGAGFLLTFALGLYVFHFSGSIPAQTIVNWDKTMEEFHKMDQDIQRNRILYPDRLIRGESKSRVYNPKTDIYTRTPSEQKMLEESPNYQDVGIPVPLENQKIGNSLFRLFIWRDALKEIARYKPVLGFDFGKPFLSESLMLIRAGASEWERDGWISIHSAFVNIIFRAGLFGIAFIGGIFSILWYMTRIFIRIKSLRGLFLCAILLAWLVMSNFAVILELPYGAIPFWTLSGLTLAFAHDQLKKYSHAHSDRP